MTAADLGTFEGRTGRAGAGQHALVVAEDDLGVGTDVNQQADLIGKVGALSQYHAGSIGTNMPGDARQHVNPGIAMYQEINLHRPQRDGPISGQRKRGTAQLHRIDAQKEVVHDGVANEGGLQDVLRRDSCLRGHIKGKFVQRSPNCCGHVLVPARIHHDVRDPTHQVFAKTDLGVHDAS